jgi:hypothetical protein
MSPDTDPRGMVASPPDPPTSLALDDALENTFPASDPVSALQPAPRGVPERPVVKREVDARQGVTGHNVRYVLGWGIAGIVIAFAIVYLAYKY